MPNFDPEFYKKLQEALSQNVVMSMQTTAIDGYILATTIGMAARHPNLDKSIRDMGFTVARRIEQFISTETGMPPSYQLGEHVDNASEYTALMNKHLVGATDIEFKLSPGEAFNIVGLLQLAVKYPDAPELVSQTANVFGRTLQVYLTQVVRSREVYEALEHGWSA